MKFQSWGLNLKERNVNNIFAYKSFCWCKNVIIVELLTVMTYIVTNCITVLLLIIVFLKYSSCFVSFSSRWDQVVSLLVQKPQNFTEQKMFQTDSRTQVCGPKIVYIVYSCHSNCWQRIDSLYSFKNYVKINWIHKIAMKLILKLILRFSFDDWFSIYVAMCNF